MTAGKQSRKHPLRQGDKKLLITECTSKPLSPVSEQNNWYSIGNMLSCPSSFTLNTLWARINSSRSPPPEKKTRRHAAYFE